MSTITTFPPAAAAPLRAPAATVAARKAWLVGPWFDLLFLANLGWPLIVLAALLGAPGLSDPLGFVQVYFLSTPHRWITLVLVFCDEDRFRKEPWKFGGMALGLVGFGLALVGLGSTLPSATDSLTLLMMVDYVWNAWHFAAQHAGIARIYGRMARPDQPAAAVDFERMAVRTLILWVFLRLALYVAGNGPYADSVAFLAPYLPWVDPLALLPAAVLLAKEWAGCTTATLGRVLYVTSVIVHYGAQLTAIRLGSGDWMRALFLAGAIFHAVEYLAVCRWSVQKKTTGIWRYQVTRTGLALVVFMAVLGVANALIDAGSAYTWALLTLLVSLLHYAYDGIIWKSRPKKA